MAKKLSIRTLTERRRRVAPDINHLQSRVAKLTHARDELRLKNAALTATLNRLLASQP